MREAEFNNGILEGRGIDYGLDETYEGAFVMFKKDGLGFMKSKDGTKYCGKWEKDI